MFASLCLLPLTLLGCKATTKIETRIDITMPAETCNSGGISAPDCTLRPEIKVGGGISTTITHEEEDESKGEEEKKQEKINVINSWSEKIFVQNGHDLILKNITITLIDNGYVVISKEFDGVLINGEAKINNASQVVDWFSPYENSTTEVIIKSNYSATIINPKEMVVGTNIISYMGQTVGSNQTNSEPYCDHYKNSVSCANLEFPGIPDH